MLKRTAHFQQRLQHAVVSLFLLRKYVLHLPSHNPFLSCFMKSWILFLADSSLFPPLIPSVTHSAFPLRSVCLFWINNIQLFCPQSSVPFNLFSLHDNFLLFSFKSLPESCGKVCCEEKKK